MKTRPGVDSARPYEPEKNPAIRRVTAGAIKRRKGKMLFPIATAYDAPFAQFVEAAGIDIILVGDSVGNVVLGYDETTPVTVENIVYHTQAVARGSTRAHIMADMPFGSYQVSNEDALRNAIRLVKEGGACSVKLEGGRDQAERIRAITGAGIPVVGHIGVTPQTAGLGPGFKMRTHRDRLIDDARSVEAAGAYAIVLEVVDLRDLARDYRAALDSDDRHRRGTALRLAGAGIARRSGDVSAFAQALPSVTPRSAARRRRRLENYAREVRAGTFPS